MKRIIWHWTAGAPGVIPIEADSYHFIIQPNGKVVKGVPVANNVPPLVNGAYAAHTAMANSWAIGIALDAMAGAKERPFDKGSNPITEAQVEALVKLTRDLCKHYGIPVTRQTVLSHSEVQPTLGIKQKQKWDIAWLPGMDKPGDPLVIGDKLRARVLAPEKTPVEPPRADWAPTPAAKPATGLWAALVAALAAWFTKGRK
jgi:hypothetical protein